jgi:hypothetical protein
VRGEYDLDTLARILLYIAKRFTGIIVFILVVLLVISISYDCSNIFITLNEGLNARADVVFGNKEITSLNKFFTPSFLSSDPMLVTNPYEEYVINDYDYRLKVVKWWAWPWSNTGKATIQEIVPKIRGELRDRDDDEEPTNPPKWQNGEKVIILKKSYGNWRIDNIVFKKSLDKFTNKK